jgi:tetratricopeptide (TPR) repeat protein
MYGALESVIATVPKGYKWLFNIMGMKGSLHEGMQKVKTYTNSNDAWAKLFFNEASFIYPYLLFFIENKKEEALHFVQQKKLDLVNNHLNAYMTSNLALNNKEVGLSKLTIQNRNLSDDYLKLSVWDFQMGYAQLYHLDYTSARIYFESFSQNFKGKFYVKDVYQKISWCYYLQGNMKLAEDARKQVLKKGSTETDADKKALKDAKANFWPNQLLLKARLLNDGGYHIEAYKLLVGKSEDNFEKEEEKLEFAYRAARIYDDLGKKDDAIRNYLIAIRIGINRKEYFAARAALQIAQIYEARGQKNLAIEYYQKCLNMEHHEYKDSLDQRAKSGIARCKGD